MLKKPALASYFIDVVNTLGGDNCKSWTQVARSLYHTHQYKVTKPESLKSIYEYLTKQNEDFTQKEIGTMISVFIEYRGDNMRAMKRFEELVGKKMARGRFIYQVKREIGKVLKQIILMFTRQKQHNLLLLRNRPERSVITMVQAVDLKNQTDSIILDIQHYGSKLEQVMYNYAKSMHLSRTQIYSELRQIVTRRQMEYVIYYMQYIHELRLISIQSKDQDYLLMQHPLLLKSIELNEQTPTYKALISKTDWFDKYEMYNKVDFQDNTLFKMPVEQLFPDSEQKSYKPMPKNQQIQIKQLGPKKRIKLQKETENQFKMVRGRLMKEGDLVQRGWKTIIFKNEEDEDNADFIAEEKRVKLQALYEEAFGITNK